MKNELKKKRLKVDRQAEIKKSRKIQSIEKRPFQSEKGRLERVKIK